jgi:hypothetical protein
LTREVAAAVAAGGERILRRAASGAALTAVVWVSVEVDAGTAAGLASRWAFGCTLALGADFARSAARGTTSAVVDVRARVDALAAAVGRTEIAIDAAYTVEARRFAGFGSRAARVTASTMIGIHVQIDASLRALFATLRTTRDAATLGAERRSLAEVAARPAVRRIRLRIHAGIGAMGVARVALNRAGLSGADRLAVRGSMYLFTFSYELGL